MSQNKKHINARRVLNGKDILDIILNNDSEVFQNIQSHTIKAKKRKTINFFNNDQQTIENDSELPFPFDRRIRNNSVDLYKRHKREKENNIKEQKNINNQIYFYNNSKNNNNNNINNKAKTKRVNFKEPNPVEIIEVESYKKYNEENTSKDPYEYLFNKNKNEKKDNGNAKAVCSCFIF